jgi:hypothetical protein
MRTVVVSYFRGFTGEMTSDWAGPVGVVSAFTLLFIQRFVESANS